jgi:hypothetical protein
VANPNFFILINLLSLLFVFEPWRERHGPDAVWAGFGGFFSRSDCVNREVKVLIPVAVFDRRLAEIGHGRGLGRCADADE